MTQETINELKIKYGKIFKLTINNEDWFYRAMTREEFKNYTKEQASSKIELQQTDLEDMVFLTCNLNNVTKDTIKNIPAGVPGTIADAIMKATGFVDAQEPVEL